MSAAGQLRILHTADVHLSEDLDPEARLVGWRAFLSQAGQADLLVVAGDLFDHARVPQSLLDQVVEDLAATPVPVVILPGNHDLAGPGSVQERFDVSRAGPHVISLDAPDGSTVEVPGLDVTV
ncbi:MAG TPA: metallophosphoesterase, partial [Streptosporangiaceae bacterium]